MTSRRATSPLATWSALLWIVLGACAGDTVTSLGDSETPDTVVSTIRVKTCACYSSLASSERTIGVLGTQVRISAEALAADGTVLYRTGQNPGRFSWSSSAPDVATVEMGTFPRVPQVTGVSEGTATITASSQGVTGELAVTVRDRARLAWSVPLAGEFVEADIAIGADGTIYAGTFGGGRSTWFAVSPQGAILWTLDLPDSRHAPAIGADGTLYGGLGHGGLIAVGPEGTIRWVLEGIDAIRSSPAIGPDGTIYVAGHSHVYAVDPQGELEWAYENADRVFAFSSPAVASDGTIYVGGKDGLLYAISPEGSLRWTFDGGAGSIIYASPAIGRDGTIYFGSSNGLLYEVAPDGSGGARPSRRPTSAMATR